MATLWIRNHAPNLQTAVVDWRDGHFSLDASRLAEGGDATILARGDASTNLDEAKAAADVLLTNTAHVCTDACGEWTRVIQRL